MGETVNMHYVPKTYLKRFSLEVMKAGTKQHYIYALEKSKNLKGKIERRKISGICNQDYFYTMPGESEEERQFFENYYKVNFEDGYKEIYDILSDDQRDAVTKEERHKIISFVVSLMYRNIYWTNVLGNFSDETIDRLYQLAKRMGSNKINLDGDEISIEGKSVEQMKKDRREKFRLVIVPQMVNATEALVNLRLEKDSVSIINAQKDFEFITSDNPVRYRSADSRKEASPIDPNNVLWLPIDNKRILELRSFAETEDDKTRLLRYPDGPLPGFMPSFGPMSGSMASLNNSCQLQQAQQYLLGTESGLKKFQQNPLGIYTDSKK